MYRSSEIIQIFNEWNLTEDITKFILEIERQLLFQESFHDWLCFSRIAKREKFKRFFYDDNNILFLQEIKEIQGNFNNLKKYKLQLWNIHRENQSYSIYLNSIRY
tara:strand:- start:285 stop:599 length:315 start_codon:yes stop_codon:yes gene_type:complete